MLRFCDGVNKVSMRVKIKSCCCDVIPVNRFVLLTWITAVKVILTKRFSRLLKVCDTVRHRNRFRACCVPRT